MKIRKINFDRLITLICLLYIAATVIGVVLTNKYYIENLGTGISPINILIEAIPLMACLAVLLKSMNLLQMDERLPILFYSLILISFSMIQAVFILASVGKNASLYYIIDIIQLLLHVAAAVFLILTIIGKDMSGIGKTCSWGALGITIALFLTAFSLYDSEQILHITLFPQIASCASALLVAVIFIKLGRSEE